MRGRVIEWTNRWRRLDRRRRAVSQTALWFGGTYAATRGIRYLQLDDRFPGGGGLQVKGEQIHHYVWGLVLLGLQGFTETIFEIPVDDVRRAAPFGAGLALALDELDILLNANDWYWAQQGRPWLDIAVLATTLGVLGTASATLWTPIFSSPTETS